MPFQGHLPPQEEPTVPRDQRQVQLQLREALLVPRPQARRVRFVFCSVDVLCLCQGSYLYAACNLVQVHLSPRCAHAGGC